MKVLVTGGNGQLGKAFAAHTTTFDIVALDRHHLDIINQQQVFQTIAELRPDVVVHAAAYTNVDGAETDIDGAYRVNVIGTQNVAAACYQYNSKMVYVSTDYVFDGTNENPYTEFDAVNPQSIYGKTKLEGERLAARLCPRLFIARTAWLYGDGNNFVKTMLRLAAEKEYLTVVNDQFGSPTNTADLAAAILRIAVTDSYGTYHMTNNGVCSWFDFACEIMRVAGIDREVRPVTSAEFIRPAARPQYSVLRNYMLELTIGDPFRPWQDALREYIKAM